MQDFKKLKIWQEGHELAVLMYKFTSSFPKEGIYGVTSQLRRAASSVSANIAEGCGRGSDADFSRFLKNSLGSANEVENFCILAKDLSYLKPEQYECLILQLSKIRPMLIRLIVKIRDDNK